MLRLFEDKLHVFVENEEFAKKFDNYVFNDEYNYYSIRVL